MAVLHILGVILKILGIAVLSVIGLVILLILLVSLVRVGIDAEYIGGNLKASAKVCGKLIEVYPNSPLLEKLKNRHKKEKPKEEAPPPAETQPKEEKPKKRLNLNFSRDELLALAKKALHGVGHILTIRVDRFMLHYNMPPFATGETGRVGSPKRREIGHGHLAWRALKPMVPLGEENPYAVRIVSDILESNGSSSMATVCAGTLALMDAGVKLKKPVSGIAMGLISDSQSGKWAVLSDILGDEDHLGDMDFKVTGTKDGITATQMDIKVDGLSYEVLAAALEQARKGRLHILDKITECIAEPREDYKPFVPRIVQITIPQDMIGAVIGPGGKVIQDIQKTTGTTITITEVDNKGIVDIFGQDKTALDGALNRIKAIVAIPEIGETYHGKIRSIVTFGAFVEIMPGKDALLHISEIDYKRFETMEETGLKEGDEIDVKLIGMDPKTNKLKLSRKVLLPKPEGYVERERRPRGERPERGERHERHGRPERKEE